MRRRYVVAYDVTDPKRLRKLHSKMRGFGDPVQYSVFICDLLEKEKVLLVMAVDEIINHREDRVIIIDTGSIKGEAERIEFIGVPLSPVEERVAVIV